MPLKLRPFFCSQRALRTARAMEKASAFIVPLVNPRFVVFNRPLFLALTVAVLSCAAFVPVLAFYLMTETRIELDNSVQETSFLTGSIFELKSMLRDYVKLPARCRAGNNSTHFSGVGHSVSGDGLTRSETTCDYEACILDSYLLVVKESSLKPVSEMCTFATSWMERKLPLSDRIFSEWVSMTNQDPLQLDCAEGPDGDWCSVSNLAETYRWVDSCCHEVAIGPPSSTCQSTLFTNHWWKALLCSTSRADAIDYYEAVRQNASRKSVEFGICPSAHGQYEARNSQDLQPAPSSYGYRSYIGGTFPDCTNEWASMQNAEVAQNDPTLYLTDSILVMGNVLTLRPLLDSQRNGGDPFAGRSPGGPVQRCSLDDPN
eukprot:s2413_g1.t1